MTEVPGFLDDVSGESDFALLAQSAGVAIDTASSAKAEALRSQIQELKKAG
jgi:hypothetical protein